jgi:Bacterial Ig-like domain (group 2)
VDYDGSLIRHVIRTTVSAVVTVFVTAACATSPTSFAPAPTISALVIVDLPSQFEVGDSAQLRAVVRLSDGSEKLLTASQITWQISNASVATISPTGLLLLSAPGPVTVTVRYETLSSSKGAVVLAPVVRGVVHESAPTQDVVLANARVESFDGTTSSSAAETNALGAFTVDRVKTGMVLKVSRSGYLETSITIRLSSLSDGVEIGLAPTPQTIQEDIQGFVPCVGFPSRQIPLDPNWEAFRFPVHNTGPIMFQMIRVPSFECGNSVFIEKIDKNGKQPFYNNACCSAVDGRCTSVTVTGGYMYNIIPGSDCLHAPPVAYHVIFSHPN